MSPLTGYFIADKASIKALTANERTNGYTRATSIGTDAEWYMFMMASTAQADDDLVLMPDDNPTTGRWHKYASNRGGTSFGGQVICTSGCTSSGGGSGKAFQFYTPQTVEVIIQPGFDINIQPGNDAIRVYRWSQMPNTDRTGQEANPVIQLPNSGGKGILVATSTYRWASVYCRDPANNNYLDGVCCDWTGNVITPLGYS